MKWLSGGQVKRMALAVGMVRRPKLLMADEPLSGLAETDAIRSIRCMYEFANYRAARRLFLGARRGETSFGPRVEDRPPQATRTSSSRSTSPRRPS